MLIPFFFMLREGGLKPSITELLTLLEAMKKGAIDVQFSEQMFALGKDEISTLATSFNRMRRSMEKALRLLR